MALMNNHDASAAFYDTWAERYDVALAQNNANEVVRVAFQKLVQTHVSAGSLLMDFGCGTGTDALAYIRMGYPVLAYDNSPGMMATLEKKGHAEIANGTLVVARGRYEETLEHIQDLPRPMAVVSNFAVLNQIENVGEWLKAMAADIESGGWIIVSVLNPTYWWDMGRKWWWRGLRGGWGKGYIEYPTPDGFSTYRHFVGALKRCGNEAGLRLKVHQSAGILLPLEQTGREQSFPFRLVGTIEQKWGKRWAIRSLGNFIFLGWQKE
jgi:2-polyprenyl-3-methyl-5-hydroxy-6-metoxy-1,4-benzoquinol methylase